VTERKRAERALRRARARALETRFATITAERTRLAREIHDTLLQGFTGVGLRLVAVANRVPQPETAAALREVVALAQKTLEDARRAVWDMRSPSVATGEFPALLRSAAEDCTRGTDLSLDYEVERPPRPVDPEVEAVVVRVAQEAMTNTVKHAAARTLRVRCTYGGHRVLLSIADDGKGFTVDPDFRSYGGHWGLLGMRERAGQIGGSLRVGSAPGQGTKVLLLVPYVVRGGSGASAK
jgi:signal transduction histidine kinase